MAIKYIIKRYSNEIKEEYQRKIVGFGIVDDQTRQEKYIESILDFKDIIGLTDEQCIKLAFDNIKDDIKRLENTLSEQSVIGVEYVPE